MINFKRCHPDANSFNQLIKFKPLKDWEFEFVELGYGIGYWIVENPFLDDGFELFKNVINSFPIQKNNSLSSSTQPNPFDTVHVPEWVHKDLCLLVRDFYLQRTKLPIVDPQVHEWGNVYYKSSIQPISCWRIPHMDYDHGMVANLWFTNHKLQDSCTKIYKYHGNVKDLVYDFQVDTKHKMHEEWRALAEVPKKSAGWFNTIDADLVKWGFEYLGSVPTKEKTLSMYEATVCHTPFISENVDFRWSHTFAFSHLTSSNLNLRDFFKI
jgi:hypothetical protein